jgi:hypothetical protein
MKNLLLIFCFISQYIFPQAVPEGYIVQYSQNFTASGSLSDFMTGGSGVISLYKNGSNQCIKISDTSSVMQERISSPAIIKNYIFGDFIIEFDAMLPAAGGSPERPYMVFSYRDTANYYYGVLSSDWYDPSGGIFMISKNIHSAVKKDSANTWRISREKWTHFRIERNITGRSVKIFATDMKTPVLQTSDPQLVMGRLGFGTFAGTVYFDNIKIWAPTFIPVE